MSILCGISCLHYRWDTLHEAFDRAQNEISVGLIEFSTNRVEPELYGRCRLLAERSGMRLGLHAWDNVPAHGVADGRDILLAHLETCKKMGVEYLVIHVGSHPRRAEGLELMANVCEAIAPAFEEAGVVLCLENHYLYEYEGKNELGGEPDDFLVLFSRVDSPAVRFCLDYGHSHMSQNTSQFISQLSSHLVYTHIADNYGEHDDHVGFGEGTVDWPAALTETLATGFRGPFVIEFPEHAGIERFGEFMQLTREIEETLE